MTWKRKGVLNRIDKSVASLMFVKVREVLILKQQPLRIKKPSEKHQSPNNNKWQFKEVTCEKSEAPSNTSWEQKSQVGNVGHEDATLKINEAKWNI
jgi:hypothetical protein